MGVNCKGVLIAPFSIFQGDTSQSAIQKVSQIENIETKNAYICDVKWHKTHKTDILKVFFAVLTKKSDSFKEERTTNSTHFLYICHWCTHTNCVGVLQVWGIASFILFKVLSEPLCK